MSESNPLLKYIPYRNPKVASAASRLDTMRHVTYE